MSLNSANRRFKKRIPDLRIFLYRMGRKKDRREILEPIISEPVTITGISAEGLAIARLNEKVVFVEGAVPGDVCTLSIYKSKKSFSNARMDELIEPSPFRVTPLCSQFGICGGCTWQNLVYSKQIEFKQQQVLEAFKHIAGININEVIKPILGSPDVYHYRNRLDYACADRIWLQPEKFNKDDFKPLPGIGFHMPGSYSKVLDVEECFLQPDLSNQIRREVKRFSVENDIPFFNNYAKEGVLRSLLVRNTVFTNQWMVLVMVYHAHPMLESLMAHLRDTFPQLTSLHYVVNPKVNDTFYDLPIVLFSGKETIEEELNGIRYRINPKSFFQTNSRQALHLFNTALDMAGLQTNQTVYDLYTGTGSLALMAAKRAKFVTGVELVPEAIEDAYTNARLNGIENVKFFAGDMAKTFNSTFIEHNGVPDLVITDPPRAGMVPKVVEAILNMQPKRIVYISCNPATQARDIALMAYQYKITAAQPVDMFPHTKHVENIIVLDRL